MKAAVLGCPISHSLSPALHRAAYAALGLYGWSYDAIECDENGLAGLLAGLDESWAGLSLTMPLKRAVLPLLDKIDSLAAEVGAANTVVLRGGGRHGYNTDVGGMVDALTAGGAFGAPVRSAPALIIGAGATACSALAALREIGINVAEVAARDIRRAGELLAAARRLGFSVRLHDLQSIAAAPRDALGPARVGLAVCTIPPGAADTVVPWLCGGPASPHVVFDVAYQPWPTRLAAAAATAGSTVVGGFDLLLYQAGRQVRLMTGYEPPLRAMRQAGLAELAARPRGSAAPPRHRDPPAEGRWAARMGAGVLGQRGCRQI